MFVSFERGGAEEHTLSYVRWLIAQGHPVDVGFPPHAATELLRQELDGLGARCFPVNIGRSTDVLGRLASLKWLLTDLLRALAFFVRSGARKRYVSMPYPEATLGGLVASALLPGSTHAHFHVARPGWRTSRLLQRIARAARVRSSWTAISPPLAEALCAGFACDIAEIDVIPNGVDLDALRSACERTRRDGSSRDLRSQVGAPTDVVLVLCVARLSPQKGHRGLLDAATVLMKENLPFVLLLVGDGPQRAALTAQIVEAGLTHHVHLAGNQRDISTYLAASDAFVLASRWEGGLPLAAMEAMAVGLPTVLSTAAAASVVEHDTESVVVPTDDTAALAAALRTLVYDREKRLDLASRGRQFADRHLAEDAAFRRLAQATRLR